MRMGSVLCDMCGNSANRISLGLTHGEAFPMGDRVLQIPAEEVSISTVLRDVISREGDFLKLSCGHLRQRPMFLLSSQEWFIDKNGERIEGQGLPLVECLR